MPLDLQLLPDKPRTVSKGGFSLDLESLPDKLSSFNINLDLLPDRPGTKPDLHWIGEGIKGTVADIIAMPYRALGIRAPVEGAFFYNVKSIGEWVNEPIGYKKEMMPNRIVTPFTDRSKVKWQEKEIPISRGTVLAEAGVNIAALALLGKVGYDELRNVIQSPQVQLGLNRLVTEGRGIVWRAQKLAGMQPPSALIPVEDSQIAQALKEGRMSYFDAMRVSPSLRQKEIAIRQPGTPEFIARQQTVSREFNICSTPACPC